jgi:hypothetical protein
MSNTLSGNSRVSAFCAGTALKSRTVDGKAFSIFTGFRLKITLFAYKIKVIVYEIVLVVLLIKEVIQIVKVIV